MSRKRKYLRKYEEGGSKPEIKLPLKGDGGGLKWQDHNQAKREIKLCHFYKNKVRKNKKKL